MYRDAIASLELWWTDPARKPLPLRGARQVGKSTLVLLFASARKLRLCELNLERALRLAPVFASLKADRILDALAHETGVDPREGTDALIFLTCTKTVPNSP